MSKETDEEELEIQNFSNNMAKSMRQYRKARMEIQDSKTITDEQRFQGIEQQLERLIEKVTFLEKEVNELKSFIFGKQNDRANQTMPLL
jgi:hypothetical protein